MTKDCNNEINFAMLYSSQQCDRQCDKIHLSIQNTLSFIIFLLDFDSIVTLISKSMAIPESCLFRSILSVFTSFIFISSFFPENSHKNNGFLRMIFL